MGAIPEDDTCSIARSLGVLGERWTLLIIRDALEGFTRFQEFRRSLGVAADVLTARLAMLVEHGVMTKVDYQEPGERRRSEYRLTEAGRELYVVLSALQQWGDRHVPADAGPSLKRVDVETGASVHVGFVGDDGMELPPARVELRPTESYSPLRRRLHEERQARAGSR
ncbi:helix-turn-helix domain-containing protein [Leifsonia shinshuensis]|uniref:winged helix-turn-helix transcriptional regulator n=1 Tax=Leifsonia shinshuensis TaxID=150026 RepID=UPI00285B2C94|nr:helix-turn-helix domain-containing protein [Leifsonia shinshuensis]MDR6971667.1 DNA-binding HxlR family transcriptional regulator [Leifsonia shinshuensis]